MVQTECTWTRGGRGPAGACAVGCSAACQQARCAAHAELRQLRKLEHQHTIDMPRCQQCICRCCWSEAARLHHQWPSLRTTWLDVRCCFRLLHRNRPITTADRRQKCKAQVLVARGACCFWLLPDSTDRSVRLEDGVPDMHLSGSIWCIDLHGTATQCLLPGQASDILPEHAARKGPDRRCRSTPDRNKNPTRDHRSTVQRGEAKRTGRTQHQGQQGHAANNRPNDGPDVVAICVLCCCSSLVGGGDALHVG